MNAVYDRMGTPIPLGAAVGRGGEATIYRVQDQPNLVAKVFVMDAPSRIEAKVAWMLAHPPDNPTRADGHVSFAWPLLLIYDQQHAFRGYLVAYIQNAAPLLTVFNPRLRAQALPGFDLRYLHRAARNLAATVGAIHARGYVIGDMHESNVMVNPSAMVTFVDTDSFQVREKGLFYPCPVGKPEYTPPELQGQVFARVQREPFHDRFGLGILIFQLLMEGSHPFRARWLGYGDPLPLEERIQRGGFPYQDDPPCPVAPPHTAPTLDVLHPLVRNLVGRCFLDGHDRPRLRPAPAEWEGALVEAEKALTACAQGHVYSNHLLECPRCHPRPSPLPTSCPPLYATPTARPLYQLPAWPQSTPSPIFRPPSHTASTAKPIYQAPVRSSGGYAPAGQSPVSPAPPKGVVGRWIQLPAYQKFIYAAVFVLMLGIGCAVWGSWNDAQPPVRVPAPIIAQTVKAPPLPTSTPTSTPVPRAKPLFTFVAPGDQAQCQLGIPLLVEEDVVIVGQSGQEPLCQPDGMGVYVFTLNQDGTGFVAPAIKLENPEGARGRSLAMSEWVLAVGAPDAKNEQGISTGAVYVYIRSGFNSWDYVAKLVAPDGADGDGFGESVAVDSEFIAVGARRHGDKSEHGVVYVFRHDYQMIGRRVNQISAPDEVQGTFGRVITIYRGWIFVGAQNGNLIYAFDCCRGGTAETVARLGNPATFDDTLVAGAEGFWVNSAGLIFELGQDEAGKKMVPVSALAGSPSSIATDGRSILVGSVSSDLVYVLSDRSLRGRRSWLPVLVLEPPVRSENLRFSESAAVPPLQFGAAVDVSGDWLVVGAPWSNIGGPHSGAVFVYRLSQARIE